MVSQTKTLAVLLVSLMSGVLVNVSLAPLLGKIVISLVIVFGAGGIIWDTIVPWSLWTAPGGGNRGNVTGHADLPCSVAV